MQLPQPYLQILSIGLLNPCKNLSSLAILQGCVFRRAEREATSVRMPIPHPYFGRKSFAARVSHGALQNLSANDLRAKSSNKRSYGTAKQLLACALAPPLISVHQAGKFLQSAKNSTTRPLPMGDLHATVNWATDLTSRCSLSYVMDSCAQV